MADKSKDTGITTQQTYHKNGVSVFPGSNARVAGWDAVRYLLVTDPATNTPWMQIFDTCGQLAREFEEAITSATNPEDVDTDGSDHAIDDCRYFAMSRPEATSPPPSKDPKDRLDPSSRREWDAVEKMRKQSMPQSKAIMSGFNDAC